MQSIRPMIAGRAYAKCTRYDALPIANELITGLGRTAEKQDHWPARLGVQTAHEAPAIEIARKLIERARVRVHDPVAMDRFRREYAGLAATCCGSAPNVAHDADALVLVTEWPEYREMDCESLWPLMRIAMVLDGRNSLDKTRMTRAGYLCLTLA